jgi:AcrR family transcriptional regulator
MQVLKDEVKDNILEAAKAVFLKTGYKGATMRTIADQAGITVGNLYRYYKNKEALYEAIIDPAFAQIRNIILNYRDFVQVGFDVFKNELVEMVCYLYVEFRDEIIIVLKGAKGTQYEGVENQLKDMILTHVYQIEHNHIDYNISEKDTYYTISLITGAFLDVVIRLMIEQNTLAEFKKWFGISVAVFFADIHERITED